MTKLKNKLFIILLAIASALCCVIAGYTLTKKPLKANASTETPSLTIVSNNLSYADSIYMIYAVSYNGFDKTQNEIKMLFWEDIQQEYTLGTEKYTASNKGYATVKEQDCLIFYSGGIAAKEMTDDIYARAYVEIDGEVYYSDVMKNSVLEYVHTKREAGGLTEQQTATFDAMLNYGATVQNLLGYNVNRLANETYYRINVENGTLADGFPYGLYKANDIITIQANEAEAEKYFSHWEDSTGESVGAEQTQEITVSGANTYTAVYEEEKKYSEGLAYTLSSDSTYYSVTGIGDCTDTKLVIPEIYNNLPVKVIDDDAFSFCTSLTSITIPNSVTTIGSWAFYYCDSLTSVEIGNSVTSIGNEAFYCCDSLTSVVIPDSVTSIGNSAFYWCGSLTSVEIGNSVTSIGDSAFANCNNLTSIEVDENNLSYKDIDGNLYTKDGTTLMQYAIGKTATSFTIPDSVTSIGNEAFRNCDSLTSVVIPDSLTSIGNYAFYDCNSLTSVEIPDSVTSIGSSAFYNCDSLTSVVIPDSVTSIGSYAFRYCTSLTSVEIGNSVTSIGNYAFFNCDSLTSIEVDENNANYKDIDGNLYSKDGTMLMHYAIGKTATSFTIPDSVTSIGNDAFRNCSLTSVEIGDSVTSIGNYAFYSCTKLINITFNGTIGEWNAIEKGFYWNSSVPATEVVCTDGSVALE